MKKGFTKKRYQLILLIIPCIIILAYIYFTQSNKIDTIKLKRRLFTTYSPSKIINLMYIQQIQTKKMLPY